jgi:hypothetical protein
MVQLADFLFFKLDNIHLKIIPPSKYYVFIFYRYRYLKIYIFILPGLLNQRFSAGVEFFSFSLEPLFCGFNYSLFNRKNLQNNFSKWIHVGFNEKIWIFSELK